MIYSNPRIEQNRLRLESLMEVNQLLMGAVEPDEVINVICDSAKRLISSEACSIALIDEEERQLLFAFSSGGADVAPFRMKLGQGIIGWVAKSGDGIICNDVSKDPRWFKKVDHETGFKTKSILCAPMKQRGRLIGAIEVLNTTRPEGFNQEDLNLLTTFGGLSATAIDRAKTCARIKNVSASFQEVVQARYRFIIGRSESMQAAFLMAQRVAVRNTTVLLLGESGTGKEVMARSIHEWSPRASHPFIAVNCVALSPDLIESELFGHEKGAFSGAIAQKKGKFELGDGGTVFLDEIGDIPAALQTKLLRILQEKEFQRVGGTKDIRTDVRILAATNRDLKQAIKTGDFREDLYYRLNVVPITMPPLRDRQVDIPKLVTHFITRYCLEVKRSEMEIEAGAMELLKTYAWPGNVRQLQNAIERAVVLSPGPTITKADLPIEICNQGADSTDTASKMRTSDKWPVIMAEVVNDFKRALIQKALEKAGGNQSEAARLLTVLRTNLSRMMKQLGLR